MCKYWHFRLIYYCIQKCISWYVRFNAISDIRYSNSKWWKFLPFALLNWKFVLCRLWHFSFTNIYWLFSLAFVVRSECIPYIVYCTIKQLWFAAALNLVTSVKAPDLHICRRLSFLARCKVNFIMHLKVQVDFCTNGEEMNLARWEGRK